MTDLHCHILPGMDDGAKDTAVSLELLRREYEDGVRNIAFTSHFNSERTTVEAFTAKRQAAFEQLTAALEGQPMQFDFKLGAEVFFSPGLCELDTRALCMGDTAYLLLEFPTTHKPHFIRQTLYNLQQQGIVPLIAHIERYPYVLEDPTLLYDWVAAGAYAQINVGALLEPKLCKKLCKFIQWGLVHVISTDTHSPDKRPPRMAQGVQQLEKLLGRDGKPLTKSVEIRFPGQVETPLKAKVSEVNIDAENDIARFVLSCEIINGDVLRLNCADAQIIVGRNTGLRVPAAAVHYLKEDGSEAEGQGENYSHGVYVKYGNLARFCRIDPVDDAHPQITDGDDLIVLPSGTAGSVSQVRLYDEIIVSGQNLYDGKLL